MLRFEKLLNPNIQYTRSVDWPSVREFFTLVQSEPGSVPREFEDPMKDYAGTDATIVRLNEHLAKRKKQVEAQQEKLAEQQSSITSSMATYRTLQSANTTLSSQVQQLKAELEKANETIRLHDSHRINLEQVTESRDTWHSAFASELETKATQLNKKQIEINDLQTDFESVQENIHRLETECTRTEAYNNSQVATVMLAPKPAGFALMPNAPKKKSESFRLLSKIFASRIARKTTMMTPQKGE
ncbi:hypothetical protein SLS60_004393 [Paraconiothyrium brasiliense]|uniref:Uncharacterized protein n=1 Tax=Paraconiothyrium brasiliense TaxID=300254 RepID=A0ABR3RK81_9PLEO